MKPIQLPDASTGMPYKTSLAAYKLSEKDMLSGIEAVKGLSYETHTQCLQGTPEFPGTFVFIVKDKEEVKFCFQLFVAINPQVLWKNIASSQMTKVDNEALPPIDFHGKKLLAASRRGRSHQHKGEPREDDMVCLLNKSQWLCSVLADGAGSAKHAALGSKIASTYAATLLYAELELKNRQIEAWITAYKEKQLTEEEFREKLFTVLYPIIWTTHKKLYLQAKPRQYSLEDFNTTLLITLVKKLENDFFVLGFQIGDGVIAIYQEDAIQLLGNPDSGNFAGETCFLTDKVLIRGKEALNQRIFFKILPDFKAIFSMTDGVADPCFSKDIAVTQVDAWHTLWQKLQGVHCDTKEDQSALLLNWLNFYQKGHHDDRTITLLI